MRVALNDRLLLELELTGIIAVSLDTHCAIVIAIQFPQNQIVYGSCYLKQESTSDENF